MGVRSIQLSAFVALALAVTAVSIQTAPSSAAEECRMSLADNEAIQLASLFTPESEFENASLFSNVSFAIYATDDTVREVDGATLVDVSYVTHCTSRKNII